MPGLVEAAWVTVSLGAVSIGYLVSLAVTMSVRGWAGDRFGGRRVLLGGRNDGRGYSERGSVECGVPDDLPEVAVWVLEISRVDAPRPVVG